MTVKLGHECLAEAHDLAVALALGVKIRSALGAAHRQTGERVLEGLFKAEEFDDGGVYAGMQTQTALVRTDGGVELYAVAAVHTDLARIVDPSHAEGNKSFRFDKTLDNARLNKVGTHRKHRFNGFENLFYCLNELGFTGVALFNAFDDFCNIIFAVFHFVLLFELKIYVLWQYYIMRKKLSQYEKCKNHRVISYISTIFRRRVKRKASPDCREKFFLTVSNLQSAPQLPAE